MSSKRHLRRKVCQQKRRFYTQDEAAWALKHVPSLDPMRVYGCAWCGGFHVGHVPKAQRALEGDTAAMTRRYGVSA